MVVVQGKEGQFTDAQAAQQIVWQGVSVQDSIRPAGQGLTQDLRAPSIGLQGLVTSGLGGFCVWSGDIPVRDGATSSEGAA